MTYEMGNQTDRYLMDSLNSTFGQYRAEYIESDLFEFFTHPNYWPKLSAVRPCILEGGRGTGKTTALKGMAYEGQFALRGSELKQWESIGAYWRIESNVVTSFRGKRISDDDWQSYFAHYVNIQLCLLVLDFLDWRKNELDIPASLIPEKWNQVLYYFNISKATVDQLRVNLQKKLTEFQMSLLSPGRGKESELALTPLGAPLNKLIDALGGDQTFKDKYFAFCIDEYENLLPYQQNVINTLIKHVGDSGYTFKIGVKKNGIRNFETMAEGQCLESPADYSQIDISQEVHDGNFEIFANFAKNVCNNRLRVGFKNYQNLDIENLFPSMSEEKESQLLGVSTRVSAIREALLNEGASEDQIAFFDSMDNLSAYLVKYWSDSKVQSNIASLNEAIRDPKVWRNRRGNYAYPMLFTLRQQVVGRVKYYSGWETYIRMSDGNIRLLLQLIYEALSGLIASGKDIDSPVNAEIQTRAAELVGEQQVDSLLGISRSGGRLKKLILSLGRVFEVMARNPHGHAPEVNQFRVNRSDISDVELEKLESLLNEAVMHSALIPFTANKKGAVSGETNDADFMLHPVMSAYFGYSNRRKRRMTIAAGLLLEMSTEKASRAIDVVLQKQGRNSSSELPEQLSIYSEFLNGNN